VSWSHLWSDVVLYDTDAVRVVRCGN